MLRWKGILVVESDLLFLVNKNVKLENFKKRFKFSCLPNASFGVCDFYPDPPKGAIDVFIDKDKQVTFDNQYALPSQHQLALMCSKVVKFPPLGNFHTSCQ